MTSVPELNQAGSMASCDDVLEAPSQAPRKVVGFGLLCLAVLAWGISIPLNKLLLEDAQPLLTLILQLCGSVSLLAVLAKVLRLRVSWQQDRVVWIVMIGVLEPAAAYYLGFVGVQHTSAMHTSVIFAMEPAGIVALNALLFQRKTSGSLVLATLVSMGGVALIAADGYNTQGQGALRGDILVFAGVMAASLYVSLSSRFAQAIHIVKMLLLQQLGSLVCLSMFWLWARSMDHVAAPVIQHSFIVSAFSVGVLQFGLAFLFYFMGAQRVSGTASVLILNMIPVVGVTSSALLMGEIISPHFVMGATIVILCMVYTSLKNQR